ncbi:thiS family protein [Halorubrum sp. AJ67]|nr:thiS family protein [Halorubrum sp. AJ67]
MFAAVRSDAERDRSAPAGERADLVRGLDGARSRATETAGLRRVRASGIRPNMLPLNA